MSKDLFRNYIICTGSGKGKAIRRSVSPMKSKLVLIMSKLDFLFLRYCIIHSEVVLYLIFEHSEDG